MIPYGKQDITLEDIEAVVKVLHSDFLTQGPVVPSFEKKLSDYTGSNYAVAVNSCTSALHLACLALELGPGDILWTSPISFVASANCALYCGASVDFVDIDPDTALMSVKKLSDKLDKACKEGKLPKIVVPVHFAGQPCDMEEIYTLSKQYGFKIIEDAAHAIGAKYKDEIVGNCNYSDITVFSFHPVKIITTGEGGAALTNDCNLAEKISTLRSHGITKDLNKLENSGNGAWYYEQIDLGFNYRMTDIQAAIGVSQIDRLDNYVDIRASIASFYNNFFESTLVEVLTHKYDRKSSNHLYVIRVKNNDAKNRDGLFSYMRENGVNVNVHYIPVHTMPYYKNNDTSYDVFNNAERYYSEAISIPIYPTLSKEKCLFICKTVNNFFLK